MQFKIFELATEPDFDDLFTEIIKIGVTLIRKETRQLVVSKICIAKILRFTLCSAAICTVQKIRNGKFGSSVA